MFTRDGQVRLVFQSSNNLELQIKYIIMCYYHWDLKPVVIKSCH